MRDYRLSFKLVGFVVFGLVYSIKFLRLFLEFKSGVLVWVGVYFFWVGVYFINVF